MAEVGVRMRAAVPGSIDWAASPEEPLTTKIEHAISTDRGACVQDERLVVNTDRKEKLFCAHATKQQT